MRYPADPKTLLLLNRIVEVLGDIVGGEDFFYVPAAIRGVIPYDTIPSFPYDMVYLGPEHQAPEEEMDGTVKKFPTIHVEAYVNAGGKEDDTITRLIKHLADVQKAINDDTKPGAGQDSLGVICDFCRVGIANTDDAMLAGEGLAAFKLKIEACVSGVWGEV
jgi:hypothetical protein